MPTILIALEITKLFCLDWGFFKKHTLIAENLQNIEAYKEKNKSHHLKYHHLEIPTVLILVHHQWFW